LVVAPNNVGSEKTFAVGLRQSIELPYGAFQDFPESGGKVLKNVENFSLKRVRRATIEQEPPRQLEE
jgi:hypothetical protein